jgi:uncharacterized membrane protein YbhN (UPF0104 family)
MMTAGRRVVRMAGWVAATVLLVYCLRRVDSADVRDALMMVKWQWIALALVANGAILLSWSGLWWSIAPRDERPSYSTMFEINAVA